MTTITVAPSGEVIYLDPGETVLGGLYKAGYAYTIGCRRGGCAHLQGRPHRWRRSTTPSPSPTPSSPPTERTDRHLPELPGRADRGCHDRYAR
ncbi:MAG: hypothetical protein V9F04_05135 [Dermatophilaceae bacterium]